MGKTGMGKAGDEGRGKKLLGRWGKEGWKEKKGRRGETAMLPPREDSEGRKGMFTDT